MKIHKVEVDRDTQMIVDMDVGEFAVSTTKGNVYYKTPDGVACLDNPHLSIQNNTSPVDAWETPVRKLDPEDKIVITIGTV